MTDHEKRIREFLSERTKMRGLCPDQIVSANDSRLNVSDLRALLADLDAVRADAQRYRLLRCGRHWSVVDGVGDILRAEELDARIDAALKGASHD